MTHMIRRLHITFLFVFYNLISGLYVSFAFPIA